MLARAHRKPGQKGFFGIMGKTPEAACSMYFLPIVASQTSMFLNTYELISFIESQ